MIVGGHPGEWEGEHPADTIARLGVRGVFLAGWYDHVEVPAFLSVADVFALASVREQFGLVLVEAMACEVPPVAVDRFGPGEIIADGETGWLVEPDDVGGLAAALLEAIDDPAERARRGARGHAVAVERYGWPALARRFADVLDGAVWKIRKWTGRELARRNLLIDQAGSGVRSPCARAPTRAAGACSAGPPPVRHEHWPSPRHDRRAVVHVAGRGDGGPDTRLDRPHDLDDALAIGDERLNPIARTYLRRRLRRRTVHEDVAGLAHRVASGRVFTRRTAHSQRSTRVASGARGSVTRPGWHGGDRHAADDRSRPPPIDDVMTALRSRPG